MVVEEAAELPALEIPEVTPVLVDGGILEPTPLEVMLSPDDNIVAESASLTDEAVLDEVDLVKETKPESVVEIIEDEYISEPVHKDGEPEIVAEESLDELFTLKPEAFSIDEVEEEEDDEEGFDRKTRKKKKAKKRRAQEMEYDPDRDVMLVKRKRKHGLDWEDDWIK